MALDEIRERLGDLVGHVFPGRHGEDVVQLLQGALFGLGDPEEDHDQRGQVEAGVEAEGADGVEGTQQARERDGEHGGPEEAGGHGPSHADFAVGEREDLGAVREGHGTLAGGVEGREEEDEERDQAQVRGEVFGDDEAEPGCEERPRHLWEREKEQCPSAEGVNGPDGRPGEDEVHQAESEGRK